MKIQYKIYNSEKDLCFCYCLTCESYFPEDQFYESAIKNSTKRCKKCFIRINSERQRNNNNRYMKMLNNLRRKESRRGARVHLDESDVRYLVKKIWKNESCIRKCYDNLVLASWEPRKDIFPWNCILVTKKEARRHNRLKILPQDQYSSKTVEKILDRLNKVKEKMTPNRKGIS